MAGKGSPPGVRQGGRPKGSKNKRTIEREVVAERIVQELTQRGETVEDMERAAHEAARTVQVAQGLNRKLGKDILDDFMHLFGGMASRFQPRKGNEKNQDEAKFKEYAKLAIECASKLAPFQSPTFRAIVVSPPPPDAQKTKRFTLTIFDTHNGRNALAMADDLADEEID